VGKYLLIFLINLGFIYLIVAFMLLHKFSLVMMCASIESCEFTFWFEFKGLDVGKTVCKLGKLLYIYKKPSLAISFSPQNNWLSPLLFFHSCSPAGPALFFPNGPPSRSAPAQHHTGHLTGFHPSRPIRIRPYNPAGVIPKH
jgi:hypothetical protein